MNKYLCFRPICIDMLDLRDVTEETIALINEAGYKRRWKLIVQYQFLGLQKLQRFLNVYSSGGFECIQAIGILIQPDQLRRILSCEKLKRHNIFIIMTADSVMKLQSQELQENFATLAKQYKIFIPNDGQTVYCQAARKVLAMAGTTESILFESDYQSPGTDFEFGEHVYIDFKQLDRKRKLDLKNYFISTSYTDDFKGYYTEKIEDLANWNMFRQKGFYHFIFYMREQEMGEQEIIDSAYEKFIQFFSI